MDNLTIEPYEPNRDQSSITAMLHGTVHAAAFQQGVGTFTDGLFVARSRGSTVGLLSFDGFKRSTLTTVFVAEEQRRMGIGAALMAKSHTLLSQQEAVERSLGLCAEGDRASLQFLYKNGYYISYSSYHMEREGPYLSEGNLSVR